MRENKTQLYIQIQKMYNNIILYITHLVKPKAVSGFQILWIIADHIHTHTHTYGKFKLLAQ